MEKILIGVLKSSHNINLKKALIDKIIETKQLPSEKFSLNEFIDDIEKQWSIGFNLNQQHLDGEETKAKYEAFLGHYDLILSCMKYIFKYQETAKIDNEFEILKSYSDLLTHLLNLIKLTFLPNLNRSQDPNLVKQNILLLMAWIRCLIEAILAVVNNTEICFNLVSLLAIINSNFTLSNKSVNLNSINCLYFMQNDVKFYKEYLNLVRVLMVPLIETHLNIQEKYDSYLDKNFNQIYAFVENCLFDTCCLLILSSCKNQKLFNNTNEDDLNTKNETDLKCSLSLVNDIVVLVKFFISKSNQLFENVFKFFIDILINEQNSITISNYHEKKLSINCGHIVEFLKCFDLTRATFIIKNYLEDPAYSAIDDKALKKLLSNLIFLMFWPYENNLDEWICSLMSIIALKAQKFQLLISVCEENADFVLCLIHNKKNRNSALNVLSFFLINYQHSPKLFHKCCPKIVKLLETLKTNSVKSIENDTSNDLKDYQNLALLSFICITNFGGYPQIYKPLLDIIQNDICLKDFDAFKAKYLINNNLNNSKIFSDDNDSFNQVKSDKSQDNYLESEEENKKIRKNVTGLINLGNTCYLNCMIQSLFACKKFLKSILEIDIDGLEEFSFLNQLQSLFGYMHLSQRYAIKATTFIKHCTPSWFKFGQQQDSSEFLIFLLDILAEQLKSFRENSSNLFKLIQNSFGVQLTTECECSNCGTKTKRSDMNFYLPLSFNTQLNSSTNITNDKQSFQNLVDNFFHAELLSSENGNSYSCSKCESLQSASKRIFFTRDDANGIFPPDYLIFTLNRFIYNATSGSKNTKIMDQLEYPYNIIMNTYYNDEIIPEDYTMVAMVVHSGSSLHYGHYYSYVTNASVEEENKIEWLLANDSQISETTYESLISNLSLFKDDTPYVLFYKRVKSENSSESNQMDIEGVDKQIKVYDNQEIVVKSKKLIESIQQDNQIADLEEKARLVKKQKQAAKNNSNLNNKNKSSAQKDDDDDENDNDRLTQPLNYYSNDSGPRVIF